MAGVGAQGGATSGSEQERLDHTAIHQNVPGLIILRMDRSRRRLGAKHDILATVFYCLSVWYNSCSMVDRFCPSCPPHNSFCFNLGETPGYVQC